ncbi:MAG: extracellular solute-binding protein [Alphaproteobacteria bacterium]|nr:extracellular solute-binding protein [Alphaproteobacteria bacterium]
MNAVAPVLRRRAFLAGSAAIIGSAALPAIAQAKTLTAFGHRVHQNVATTGPGGDATAAWRQASGFDINWVTLGDVNAINERLLRELTLPETAFDLAYLLNGRAVPRNLRLFEPLDAFQREAPIEDFDDISAGLVAPMRLDGALHAIPMRHATNALVYNEALFEERGIKVPANFEEFVDAAKKLTFTRPDGTQVYGLAFTAVFASNFLSVARAFDGDYMTGDMKVTCDLPSMVKPMEALAELFKAGAIPRNFATVNNEEITTWMQQGRAAMTINPYARLVSYNDPALSRYPGKIKASVMPMTAALAGKTPYASTTEYWSFAIPRNSKNKRAAWDLIRALSSKAGTLAQARNGNGPVRVSTYADSAFASMLPYAAAEAVALKTARIHLPAFDNQARAHDVFVEESQAAVLGMKPAERAMADAARRVRALL